MGMTWGGVVWTDHALKRLKERGIKMETALATWNNPDSKRYGTVQGAWVYYKTWGNEKVEVVSKQNEKGEWVILSVWSRSVWETPETSRKTYPWWMKLLRSLFGMK